MDLSTMSCGYSALGFSSQEVRLPSCLNRGLCCPPHKSRGSLVTRAQFPGSCGTQDHHAVLEISQFATKQEIKKSYRRLALELHPDVCKGDNCSLRFQQVKRAYEALIQETTSHFGEFEDDLSDNLEGYMGVGDNSWEEWEEWMGWEGAGTYDYSNHINPNL